MELTSTSGHFIQARLHKNNNFHLYYNFTQALSTKKLVVPAAHGREGTRQCGRACVLCSLHHVNELSAQQQVLLLMGTAPPKQQAHCLLHSPCDPLLALSAQG